MGAWVRWVVMCTLSTYNLCNLLGNNTTHHNGSPRPIPPPPPTTVHSTHAIPQSAAADFLAAYLDRATTDPALQPNASISEHGPVSRTTAAAPNLILHNLKRVQAGLAGEILGRDLTVAKQNPGEDYLDIAAGAVDPTTASAQQIEGENGEEEQDLTWEEPAMETEAEAFAEQEARKDVVDKEERKRRKKERRVLEKKAKAGN
ncbi:hypothetical protein N7510_007175 [Penicillium lagena]|uniref:uncharacterized protein n=1 Tax=Penicillium lagena TaxID=94218 RepID=UPI00253F7513|nr:uncharacterized protein N7510_007175 [Penicillium lagena]KAJ5610456.1 hypothetical protein N7510_007175 [Penicillium lagena]